MALSIHSPMPANLRSMIETFLAADPVALGADLRTEEIPQFVAQVNSCVSVARDRARPVGSGLASGIDTTMSEMLRFLDAKAVSLFAVANSKWKALARSENVWEALVEERWQQDVKSIMDSDLLCSAFRSYYVQRYHLDTADSKIQKEDHPDRRPSSVEDYKILVELSVSTDSTAIDRSQTSCLRAVCTLVEDMHVHPMLLACIPDRQTRITPVRLECVTTCKATLSVTIIRLGDRRWMPICSRQTGKGETIDDNLWTIEVPCRTPDTLLVSEVLVPTFVSLSFGLNLVWENDIDDEDRNENVLVGVKGVNIGYWVNADRNGLPDCEWVMSVRDVLASWDALADHQCDSTKQRRS